MTDNDTPGGKIFSNEQIKPARNLYTAFFIELMISWICIICIPLIVLAFDKLYVDYLSYYYVVYVQKGEIITCQPNEFKKYICKASAWTGLTFVVTLAIFIIYNVRYVLNLVNKYNDLNKYASYRCAVIMICVVCVIFIPSPLISGPAFMIPSVIIFCFTVVAIEIMIYFGRKLSELRIGLPRGDR
jgi:hypothetical protein